MKLTGREFYIMPNGKRGCQRMDGSLRLHFDTEAEAMQCANKQGWDEVAMLCHCGYFHLGPKTTQAVN
jgi:hypothetical protein